jgi:hypothetical protein
VLSCAEAISGSLASLLRRSEAEGLWEYIFLGYDAGKGDEDADGDKLGVILRSGNANKHESCSAG